MTPKKQQPDVAASLEKLERIIVWFDVQVQAGLTKVREGAALVKELRAQLREVENEFKEVKRELDGSA